MDASAHAAQAAIANAIKASGVVVRLEAGDFMTILKRIDEPLVVTGMGGVFRKHFQYLTSYKGLAFFTTSESPLLFPSRVELIQAKKIVVPEM
jgi:hypothetical protein